MKKPTFGDRLKESRIRAGYTSQEAFAKALGVTRQTVNYYENGERKPDYEMFDKISQICGVSPNFLLGRDELPDMEDNKINSLTGLSEKAINTLKELKKKMDKNDSESSAILYFLNQLVQDKETLSELTRCIITFDNLKHELSKEVIGEKCTNSLGSGAIIVTGNDAADFLLFQSQQIFINFIKNLNQEI